MYLNSRKAGLLLSGFVILGVIIAFTVVGLKTAPPAVEKIRSVIRGGNPEQRVGVNNAQDWQKELERLASPNAAGGTDNKQETAPPSATEQFVNEIGSRFIIPYLQDPSAPPDVNAVTDEIVTNTLTPDTPQAILTDHDLTIVTASNPTTVALFAKHLDETFNESMRGFNADTELTRVTAAFETNDFSKLDGLNPYITALGTLIARGKKIPVPSGLATPYVRLLNTIIRQKTAVEKMQNAKKDFIGALQGVNEFGAIERDLASALQGLVTSYKTYGIAY